ncbi:MAG: SMP-30/gluconolactonase/LRE family protein [Verrucomicrobia bacterium]|nr:SMP-30/gluconolactonase/LRE family protein [Verrucomicrobiota bacterium]
MNTPSSFSRRSFLTAAATAVAGAAAAAERDWTGKIPTRYPDPDIVALDKRFKAKLGNTPIQRIHHSANTLWTEGPAWNAVGRYLLWSDIPNNIQQRWIEDDGHVSTFRNPVNNTNGNTFDYEGRQLSCEHLTRRVVRHEHNGSLTVLADGFDGRHFNAPNDVVVHPNGDIWFTDPGYGGLMNYEGARSPSTSVEPHQKEAVYRIDGKSGQLTKATDECFKPNGLCFSPDYKKLYVADTGASHYPNAPKNIKVWDILDGTKLVKGREFASMKARIVGDRPESESEKATREKNRTRLDEVAGFADGIRCDTEGNIWASAGWVGAGYDGVHIFAGTDGQRIGQSLLPEICSNVCFGGAKRNRLFMTASTSVYAVYVETQGAHIT